MTWIKGERKAKKKQTIKKKKEDIICVLYNKKHFRLCTKITVIFINIIMQWSCILFYLFFDVSLASTLATGFAGCRE
jgi:hypothetical protein